jgi:hypothetical protein
LVRPDKGWLASPNSSNQLVEELDDPCADHALRLVFQAEIAENKVLQHTLAAIRKLQSIARSRSAIRQCGTMRPDRPNTRWFCLSAVLRSIVDEARQDDLVAFLMQLFDGTDSSVVLETLSQKASPGIAHCR